MVTTATMLDFTHSAVPNVPAKGAFTYIAGYVTGTSDIVWTGSDWAKFTGVTKIRINQGYDSTNPALDSFDVLDMEKGAWTPQSAAAMGVKRVEAGWQWTTYYGSQADLETLGGLLRAEGEAIWNGHHDCILANWNLNEAEAAALIGTQVGGMTVRGVQWASPTSNPNTLLPGTAATLKGANVDLNVVQAGWKPSVSVTEVKPPAPPTPTPPQPATESAYLLRVEKSPGPTVIVVTSTDGGKTWTA